MSAKPLSRIYFPAEIPAHGRAELTPAQAHHATRVLRLGTGDALTLFDGQGGEFEARIARISKSGVSVDIGERRAVDRESPFAVTLAQAISSGERMDYTVQKAVELGASLIQPLETERAVVRLDPVRASRRSAHWESIAIAACEQCGRNRVPPIAPITALRDWLGAMDERPGLRILLSPRGKLALGALPAPGDGAILLAGPEGGLTGQEERDAERSGFTAVRLGPRVLRTETAALAALAAMQALWGDFR
jgi:16S rRNA (uracil1498-N3)-methyltransferase